MNKADILEITGAVIVLIGATILFIKNPFIVLLIGLGAVIYLAGVLERTNE